MKVQTQGQIIRHLRDEYTPSVKETRTDTKAGAAEASTEVGETVTAETFGA